MLDDPRRFDLGYLGRLRRAFRAVAVGDDGHGAIICIGRAVRRQPELQRLSEEAILSDGSDILGEVAERTAVLAVACSRCDRAGRYNAAASCHRWSLTVASVRQHSKSPNSFRSRRPVVSQASTFSYDAKSSSSA